MEDILANAREIEKMPLSFPNTPTIASVILNYNGWEFTIICLESMLSADLVPDFIVIVDNGSTDDSVSRITSWAQGNQDSPLVLDSKLSRLMSKLTPKPVRFQCVDFLDLHTVEFDSSDSAVPLVLLIKNGGNRGYAGGINLGVRLLMETVDFDYIWVSNNDVLVAPDALSHMVSRMTKQSSVGLCGPVLLNATRPDTAQCTGGHFNKWFGLTRHVDEGAHVEQVLAMSPASIERRVNYLVGASLLASREWLETVGLMDEEYFLYYEDVDWTLRGEGVKDIAVVPQALVWHFEGGATGAGTGTKSPLVDVCMLRARVLCAVKNNWETVPFVLLGLCISAVRRILRHQWSRIGLVLRAAMFGLTGRFPREVVDVRSVADASSTRGDNRGEV